MPPEQEFPSVQIEKNVRYILRIKGLYIGQFTSDELRTIKDFMTSYEVPQE